MNAQGVLGTGSGSVLAMVERGLDKAHSERKSESLQLAVTFKQVTCGNGTRDNNAIIYSLVSHCSKHCHLSVFMCAAGPTFTALNSFRY